MGWNTFLALIPVGAAYVMYCAAKKAEENRGGRYTRLSMLAAGIIWLAFLPNTCYLLTEWRHFLWLLRDTDLLHMYQLDRSVALTLMKHTFFYMCYSGIGMLTFTLSIRPIAKLMKRHGANMWLFGIPFFIMMSVGVYLGLVLRYNSWDIASHPMLVWTSVTDILRHPKLIAFLVAFSGFLWIVYLAMDIWIDGFLSRFNIASGRP